MKKIYFILFFTICSVLANAQDYTVEGNSVVYTKVIENTGMSVNEMHSALEAFFATTYNDVNSTEKLNQPDHLIYKGIFGKVAVYTMGMWVTDVHHTVDVALKDGRMRIIISMSEAYAHSSEANCTYYLCDTWPIKDQYAGGNAPIKKPCIAAFEESIRRCAALVESITVALNSKSSNDDW